MVRIVIVPSLYAAIEKRFKKQAHEIIDLFETLYENPKKGKELGHVGGTVIKELKHGVYRFYFITDGHAIKFYTSDELRDVLLKFVRMSDKDAQKEAIEQIKTVLRKLGDEGFE